MVDVTTLKMARKPVKIQRKVIAVLTYILGLVHTDFYFVFDSAASELVLSIKNLNLPAGLTVPSPQLPSGRDRVYSGFIIVSCRLRYFPFARHWF